MTSYVIELGTKSGEGKFEQWTSDGFYAGYTDQGPIILVSGVSGISPDPFRFPTRERAQTVVGGDERLRNSRINEVPESPNV